MKHLISLALLSVMIMPCLAQGGFPVYLGTIPDYEAQVEGVKLTGVRAESPAEKAGLREDDIIISLDGQKITNVYEYTAVLRKLEPEKKVPLLVRRAGKVKKLKIVPAKPKKS